MQQIVEASWFDLECPRFASAVAVLLAVAFADFADSVVPTESVVAYCADGAPSSEGFALFVILVLH